MTTTNWLKNQLESITTLLFNASWLLTAELISKLSRIATIVVLAAQLTPISYGTAMLALAFHDLFGLLLRAGVGSQIINCKKQQLRQFAQNGIIIQWLICLSIAIAQFGSAPFLASIYDNEKIINILQITAVIYLLYPWVSIKIFLLQRENKMRWFSIRNGVCITVENITIAVSALLGADILAVAIGKVFFSMLWLLLFYFSPVKSYGVGYDYSIIKGMLKTSGKLFNTEFLRGIRLHADTFIAGKLLTPELFGFYTFAKNAGVGLSQSLTQVYISALYPYCCQLQREGLLTEQYKKIYFISLLFGSLFIFQAVIAPFYVPIIFDAKWSLTIPIIAILCLAALPNLIIDVTCCIKRVNEQYHIETLFRLICLASSLISLLSFTPETEMDFALIILFSSLFSLFVTYIANCFVNKSSRLNFLFQRRNNHAY